MRTQECMTHKKGISQKIPENYNCRVNLPFQYRLTVLPCPPNCMSWLGASIYSCGESAWRNQIDSKTEGLKPKIYSRFRILFQSLIWKNYQTGIRIHFRSQNNFRLLGSLSRHDNRFQPIHPSQKCLEFHACHLNTRISSLQKFKNILLDSCVIF